MSKIQKTGIAKKEYLVPTSIAHHLQRLGNRLQDAQFMRAIPRLKTVQPFSINAHFYSVPQELLQEIYSRMLALSNSLEDERELRTVGKIMHMLERSVDYRSRRSVLGVPTQVYDRPRLLKPGEAVRVYIHTLDGKPAVYLGNRLELAAVDKTHHYETPKSLAELRKQQRNILRPLLEDQKASDELAARMGYVTYKMAVPSRGKSDTDQQEGKEDNAQ